MNMISKWKINKISMILDYVGAVIYFMAIPMIFATAVDDAFSNQNSTDGLAIFIYGYAIVATIFHVLGFLNAKKFKISNEAYIWGMCGNGLFILGALFSIPSAILVIIAGFKINKMREIEDPYYANAVDYSNITSGLKSSANSIKEKTNANDDVVCPNCGKHYAQNVNFCPECGTAKPKEPEKPKCKKCNAVLENDTKFCPICGEKVDDESKILICKNCGETLDDGAIFCGNCGTKVGE